MDDGINRKLDPGDPEERNIYEAMEAGKDVKKIPMTFGDALDALDADEVIQSALPDDLAAVEVVERRAVRADREAADAGVGARAPGRCAASGRSR